MKTIPIQATEIENIFQVLHQNLGGILTVESKEHILDFNLDNELGHGQIKGVDFKGGISYLVFDMVFSEDVTIATKTMLKNSPICFVYCSRGRIVHSFGIWTKKHELHNFQTGILISGSGQHLLYCEKNVQIKTSFIVVSALDKAGISERNTFHKKLQRIFLKNSSSENFAYVGSHNLKIAEKIKLLNAVPQQGIVRSLLIEALVQMILALEIQQYSDDMEKRSNDTGSLTSKEMLRVAEVSEFITNYSGINLSIKQLCRRSGLSPSKLQQGFRLMHGRTVTDHIREVRIQESEKLIKNTDLNISEVVYSIGFTSRSYFSKIFKKKYNCSPKQYKANQNGSAMAT